MSCIFYTSQIKRAADSVVLNIAEGSTGQTKPVFKQFLGYSLRSAIEVVSCLFIAKKRDYLKQDQFSQLYSDYEILVKMITTLRNSLN
ncbi:four helix bundle protein [Mucilaginibacter gracilis]|uniref:four helix bundle protein n=1 Tax=Mucilaginibacter gracilis TaxID=423350 RepID=UPI001FE42C05|nr:four helix bundle protein [Mucilaginibacter gracilis]